MSDERFDPWRCLAAAVVAEAVDELRSAKPRRRREARAFFHSGDLELFLAGTDTTPTAVRYALRRRWLLPDTTA